MKTSIDIDERLLNKALRLSKKQSKKDVIREALEVLVRYLQRQELASLKGKVRWDGDLDSMRAL